MSITIVVAERSTAYCKVCNQAIMGGDIKVSIYSAHHAVSWCKFCGAREFKILMERCLHE